MKKIRLLMLLACASATHFAYGQNSPDWSSVLGASNASGKSVAVSLEGDTYVLGSFNSTAKFGNTIITTAGDEDVFLVKYSSNGTMKWVKSFGSPQFDRASDIKCGSNGMIYIYGNFQGTTSLGSFTLTSNGGKDIFVAGLDTSGAVIWAKSGGSTGNEFCYNLGMDIDANNNVYVVGNLQTTTIGTFGSLSVPGGPNGAVFLVKYNSLGNEVWGKSGISGSNAVALGVATDNTGNVCMTGAYKGTLTFGTNTITSINASLGDAYLAKFDSSGKNLWSRTAGGSGTTTGSAVSCDKYNNVYIAGEAEGSINFGTITSNSGTSPLNTELFIARYDNNGTAIWAKRAGSHSSSNAYIFTTDLVNDTSGNVYWTGSYFDTLDFYDNTIKPITSSGNYNAFIIKYNTDGVIKWAANGGGKGGEEPANICFDKSSNLYVTGYFQSLDSSTKFGSYTFSADNKTNRNLFVARLSVSTGVSSNNLEKNRLLVYPNPANDYVIVKGINHGAIISIIDVVGRRLYSEIARNNMEEINTSNLLPGNYILMIQDNNQPSYYKITKQ